MATRVSRASKIMLAVTGGLALLALWSVLEQTPQLDQSLAQPPRVWTAAPLPLAGASGVHGIAVQVELAKEEGAVVARNATRFAVAKADSSDGTALLVMLRPGAAPSAEPERDAARLLDWIKAQGLAQETTLLAYDWALLEAFGRLDPEIGRAFGTLEARVERKGDRASPWLAGRKVAEVEGSLPALVKQAGGDLWAPTLRELRPEEMKEAETLGLQVMVTDVDDPAVFPSLLLLRPDAIVTDQPAKLVAEIKARPGLFAFGVTLE